MSGDTATRDEIARLFGRAAFGATTADLDAWTGKPYAEAVSHLVDIPAAGSRPIATDEPRRQVVEQAGRQNTSVTQAQEWWLERMRTTAYPLEERLTLFWHGHFATAAREHLPDVTMLVVQNQTLRQHALGNFRDLVIAMTLDPAMLEWLDGSRNTTPVPNENYARELMELFTLGKYPQVYNETDVSEAARVLTGWTLNTANRTSKFEPTLHDAGTKTVLGAQITNQQSAEYVALIDLVLRQPVAPRFLAWKLVSNLAYTTSSANLLTDADPLVVRVADTLVSTDWNIREAVRALLLSDEFRTGDTRASHELVRSPVETVVAAAKALNIALNVSGVPPQLYAMGQPIFDPPNVGGWPMGTAWLSPSTELARYSFALWIQSKATGALPASGDLDGWARTLGIAPFTDVTAGALQRFLRSQSGQSEKAKQASMLVLVLSTPEWAVL